MKDYYEDIPEDQFVPLECIDENLLGKYEINKKGEIRNKINGSIVSSKNLNSGGYKFVKLQNHKILKHYQLHRLIAETFIPNPNNFPSVDHINRDKLDNSVSNLRWFSWSDQNRNKGDVRPKNFIYAKLDDFGNEISRIAMSDIPKSETKKISIAAFRSKKYNGYYWKLIDLDLEDYQKTHKLPENEDSWIPCLRFPDILECTREGFFRRIDTKRRRILVGHPHSGNYLKIFVKGKHYFSHRLIYETFAEKLLEQNIDVGHIDTDRKNNRFPNLEECTRKENMNNYNTRIKVMKPVKQFSLKGKYLKTFDSLSSASSEIGTNVSNYRSNRGNRVGGFMWCLEGEEYQIEEIMMGGIFKYDLDGNFINWYLNPSEASVDNNLERHTLVKKIKKKIPYNGFYYIKGPKENQT